MKASAESIPLPAGFLGTVLASHVYEHFSSYMGKRKQVLLEWWRLLRKGGLLKLHVPNVKGLSELYVQGKLKYEFWRIAVYGLQNGPGEFHYAGFEPELLLKECRDYLGKDSFEVAHQGFGFRGRLPIPNNEIRLFLRKLK